MTEELYQVRLWDMMDGTWYDTDDDPLPRARAERRAGDLNFEKHGDRHAGFDDGDYFAAFPASSEMHWSNGREMFR